MRKNKIIIGTVAFFIVALAIGICCAGMIWIPSAKLDKLLSIARSYMEAGNYTQAIAEFKKSIELEPRSEEAYLGIADVYVAMAEDELAWLVGLGVEDEQYHQVYTQIYIQALSDYEQALDCVNTGLQYITSDGLEVYRKNLVSKIEDVQKEYEDAKNRIRQLEEEEAERKRQQEEARLTEEFNKKIISLAYINYANVDAYCLETCQETSFLSTEEALSNYSDYVNDLEVYVDYLFASRNLPVASAYFEMPNYDAVIGGKLPWYEIGGIICDLAEKERAEEVFNFYEACHYLIICYQAQHKVEEILEVKNKVAEVIGNDFILQEWQYPEGNEELMYTVKYNVYDFVIGIDNITFEYDEIGNLKRIVSPGREKILIYENDRVVETQQYGNERLVLVSKYQYKGWNDGSLSIENDIFENDVYNSRLHQFIYINQHGGGYHGDYNLPFDIYVYVKGDKYNDHYSMIKSDFFGGRLNSYYRQTKVEQYK